MWCVSAIIPSVDLEEPLLELLSDADIWPTTHFDADAKRSMLNVYVEDETAVDAARAAIHRAGEALKITLEETVAFVPPENWQESWKRFFHVTRVSERIVIRPVWEEYTPQPNEVVIDMEPGMSFGTGNHGTTQACLQFLDALSTENPNRSMLDIGCGSGILAIAAAKLGFAPVAGYDNDPDAVRIAQENARMNRVGEVCFFTGDLADTHERADVVVANILAPVLIEYAAQIAKCANRVLLVSGILDEQYASVLAAFEAQGFRERENRKIDIWRSGWLERRTGGGAPSHVSPVVN